MVSKQNSPTGTTVGGYELLDMVGQGGMGAVYKARAADGSIVAVKLLAQELNENKVQLRRFYQEAEIAMRLDHPNMVRALAVGEDQGRHYFAMEFVDGISLGTRLKREGTIREKDAVRIIIDVAKALHKAHKEGLIHRDVKPDNILLTSDNTAKLADMGLVKQLDADLNLTRTGRGLGTPHFMSPEQFRDAKNADPRCDVYSLGATLYMMVTGRLPFTGSGPLDTFMKKSANKYTPPEELNPKLSEKTITAIKMAMDAEPANRPASAKSFAEILVGHVKPNRYSTSDSSASTAVPRGEDVWYVIYYDAKGAKQKVKGSASVIEQQLRRGRLEATASCSQNKRGPFRPISEVEPFASYFPSKPAVADVPATVAKAETRLDQVELTPVATPSRSFTRVASRVTTGMTNLDLFLWGVAIAGTMVLICLAAWLFVR